MGVFLGRGAQLDFNAISQEMRKSVRLFENAYILIINPGPNGSLIRALDDSAFVWHGRARVQPYRREVKTPQVTDPVTLRSVRFQIDFSEDGAIPDIKTDYHIWVVPTELSGIEYPEPYLSIYNHTVDAAMNSSLAWVRTIETTVNTQVRPDYQITRDEDGDFHWVVP